MVTMTGTVGHDLCEAVGGYLIVIRVLILACRCRNGTIVIDGDSGRAGSVSCSCLAWYVSVGPVAAGLSRGAALARRGRGAGLGGIIVVVVGHDF